LTIHKLIALAAVIVAGSTVYSLLRTAGIQALIIVLIALIAACALALFISGALLSLGKPVPKAILPLHQIATVLIVLSTAGTLYLLKL
jgi:hypothetical protein